jgi:hypothetical protein
LGFSHRGALLKNGDPGDGGFVWRSVVSGDSGQKLAQHLPNDLHPDTWKDEGQQSNEKRVPPDIASHLAEHVGDEPLTNREIDVLRQVAIAARRGFIHL